MKNSKYLFLLKAPDSDHEVRQTLAKMGVKIALVYNGLALTGWAAEEILEQAYETGHFLTITKNQVNQATIKQLGDAYKHIIEVWNFAHSAEYLEAVRDGSAKDLEAEAKAPEPGGPFALLEPELVKEQILKHKGAKSEEELLAGYTEFKEPLSAEVFTQVEKNLAEQLKDETMAYHIMRILYYLSPRFYQVLPDLDLDFWHRLFKQPTCWKLENESSVGVVFIESSRDAGGPRFTDVERLMIIVRLSAGLDWLVEKAPEAANLSFTMHVQFTFINVANGNNNSEENYWRDPGLGEITFAGNTYAPELATLARFRADLQAVHRSFRAFVTLVTPYANHWHAYAGGHKIVMADRNNWGEHGIHSVNNIFAHEVLHLFGAADEYESDRASACSSCRTLHGCYQIPNGNCAVCASPHQLCLMNENHLRMCSYTLGQIGWADLLVELRTGHRLGAGTDNAVVLDIGDRTFELDNADHDDRERGNVEAYAFNYTGLTLQDIKRIGIRKSRDDFNGGWYLEWVKVWLRGQLICSQRVERWIEDNRRWWVSSAYRNSDTIINTIRVDITTADEWLAGTDDDVTFYLGDKHWNLDTIGRNDFESGNLDVFHLDPGVGFYKQDSYRLKLRKSPDGASGGWKLKGLKVYVNGQVIFDNQQINRWLQDDDRTWEIVALV